MEHIAKALDQALALNKEHLELAHRVQETMPMTIEGMAAKLSMNQPMSVAVDDAILEQPSRVFEEPKPRGAVVADRHLRAHR